MVFRQLPAVCSLAALASLCALCLSSAAQSSPQSSTPSTQSSAPAQTQAGTPPLQLHDLPPDPHTPTAAEETQQRQQRALAAASQLAGAQARWGPQISTPGLSVALTELSRGKTPGGATRIAYQISGSGFAPADRLFLVRWPLDSSTQNVMSGLVLNAKGVAVCAPPSAAPAAASTSPSAAVPGTPAAATQASPAAPSCTTTMQPNQPVEIQTTAAPGEAIRVALLGEDHRHGAATSVVPFPIANEDKGCKLQIVLGMKEAGIVLVEGSGFPPATPLNLETITGTYDHTMSAKTTADGHLVVAVLPAQPGQDSGTTTIRYAGVVHTPSLQTPATPPPPDPACAPAVTFQWGKGTYKPE